MSTPALNPAIEGGYPSSGVSAPGSFKRFLSFAGPGALVAVGYIDPGNWATDLAGGARYSYALLSVVLISSLMAMLLQALCVQLGVASGRDLAEASREAWPRAAMPLWIVAELAVIATDLAEVIGSAIALQLLLHVPLSAGVVLTVLDVLLLLGLERRGARILELLVAGLVALVAACFVFELSLCHPDTGAALRGYLPTTALLRDRGMLYVAVGIVGATVMPHNLYLHSSLVRARAGGGHAAERRSVVRHATLDTVISLGGAMLVNSAILVVAAAVFHRAGRFEVAELEEAHHLLTPLLGSAGAGVAFAAALLAAGQSATLTGTMAGQVVMNGLVRVRARPWARRLVTRGLAIGPALAVALAAGERGVSDLLVGSQVALSLALPFAVVPLLRLTADRRFMGALVTPRWMTWAGWACAIVIVALNGYLLAQAV